MAVLIFFGFSRTFYIAVAHSTFQNPPILFVHIALFSAWLILMLIQTGLVQARRLRLHRTLGSASLVIGVALPIVGVWVTIAMNHQKILHGMAVDTRQILYPLSDMVHFTALYWPAIWFRRRPEIHKRLMFLTTISLVRAAFFRYPQWLLPDYWISFGADALMLTGIGRDLIVDRRLNVVYRFGFPMMVAAQVIERFVRNSHWWQILADSIVT